MNYENIFMYLPVMEPYEKEDDFVEDDMEWRFVFTESGKCLGLANVPSGYLYATGRFYSLQEEMFLRFMG